MMFCGPGKRINGPKVWFLGDSITHGAIATGLPPPNAFAYQGSFRCAVYAAMTLAGFSPEFLGTITNASDGVACAGYGHTGINGAAPLPWRDSYFGVTAPTVDAQGPPDLVVILLGANGADNDTQAGYVWDVAQLALAMWPLCSVGLQTMFKADGNDFAIFNASLRARAAANPSVFIIEQSNSLTLADLSDGLHPNATGYKKLSDAIVNAILQRM